MKRKAKSQSKPRTPRLSDAGKRAMHADIAHDVHKGYPQKQAIAIAMRRAREGYYR